MNNTIYLIICLLILPSCEQILEENIEKKEVLLLAPADNIRTAHQNAGFIWEQLNESSSYRLQIISPDFIMPETLVLDTLISKTSFHQFLDLGKYEWRVRAENSAYQTEYSVRSLWIDTLNSSKQMK